MAPEMFNTLEANELQDLARKAREYQTSKKLSDAAMVKKFTGLGSTKTYTRILAGDLAELDLERQLNNYRAVWALMESLGEDRTEEEEIFDDLTPVLHLKRCVLETMRTTGSNRVILMEGDTGMGKTSARKALIEKYGQRLLWIEADELWNDNPMAMLASILTALGIKEQPIGAVARMEKVLGRLNENRICLLVEEAHHMGPRCLNLCKTLINRTPGEIVLIAMPTLWRRLEREAYEEVRQLTGNRLAERIKLDGIRESDVKKLIDRRTPGFTGDIKPVLKMLLDRAPRHGNLAFIRDVLARVYELTDGGKDDPTGETFATAIAQEVASR